LLFDFRLIFIFNPQNLSKTSNQKRKRENQKELEDEADEKNPNLNNKLE